MDRDNSNQILLPFDLKNSLTWHFMIGLIMNDDTKKDLDIEMEILRFWPLPGITFTFDQVQRTYMAL